MGCSKNPSFLYQINVTRDCNLRCTHCYIHSDVKKNSMFMNEDQLLGIVDKIEVHMNTINKNKEAEIHIIGGEPTMLGLPFFESFMPKLRKKLKDTNYSIILVSNLLSVDILDIAKLFDKVSTSYEPETRFPKEKLLKKWEWAVHHLLDNGIDLGATVAMTKQTISFGAQNMIDYMFDKLGIKNLHFGFFIPEGDGLVNIDATMPKFVDTSSYLIDLTDIYLPIRGNGYYINPVESMITSLTENRPMDDIVCPIISGSIDINWDGNCNSCLEAGGALNPKYSGNIFKNDIIEIIEHKNFRKEILAAKRPKKPCLTCDYHPICQGACSVLFKFYDDDMEDCPGFKVWIDYLHAKIQVT